MEFCDICNNMIFVKTETSDAGPALVRYCRFCGYEQRDTAGATGHCVRIARTNYSEDELLYTFHQNEFLRFDPTLPRVRDASLRCPAACDGSKADGRYIYIKYHPVDMKYFYVCDHCGETFRMEDTKAPQVAPLPDLSQTLSPVAEESVAETVAEPGPSAAAAPAAPPKKRAAAAKKK